MRSSIRGALAAGAVLAFVLSLAGPAGAAEIVGRDATGVHLAVNRSGVAYVSFTAQGRPWHIFVSGAVNARQPSRSVAQVKFTVDYSGGRGAWKTFANACRPYDGPKLAWYVTACKAPDGSYWALQKWQRMLPNVGYLPWLPAQKVWELHISHWTGPLAQLEVYQGWAYGGRFSEIFGRATYLGQAIHGFDATSAGVPTDTYGRLAYLDTFGSSYGTGWKRENSFLMHNPSGMFCYGFYPYSSYPGYPRQRSSSLNGAGKRYRLTLSGPGVTPDVMWTGVSVPVYDAKNPTLVAQAQQATAKVRAMAQQYGDTQCGQH